MAARANGHALKNTAVTSSPTLSVIVPTRNRARSLRRTLESLARQTAATDSFEVVVVVNDCHDDTLAQMSSLSVPYALRVVEMSAAGIALARNAGAERAQGSILVFVDDDIKVIPEFVSAHHVAHSARQDMVVVGALLAPDDTGPITPLAARLRRLDKEFGALLGRSETLDAFCMIGGNMSVFRKLFEQVGGFDVTLGAYGCEDWEFGLRAERVGARFLFAPDAGGIHYAHENTSLTGHLANARSIGRNDTDIVRRHPGAVGRLVLGRALHGRTAMGRAARALAFDRPEIGDLAARWLLGGAGLLGLIRWHGPWDRLIDSLREYWYFRGVADRIGNREALSRYLADLGAAPDGR
jgi:glycosyltransferase involved in cell wall biosynthesis